MRKILLVCAALACMTVSPVPAQDAAVKKIIEMGQNDNQVMHQLEYPYEPLWRTFNRFRRL